MGKSIKKPEKHHIGFCGGLLAGLVGLLCAAVAMIELIIIARDYPGSGFNTNFPSCDNQILDNVCVQPIINIKFAVCVYAVVTFFMSLTAVIIPFKKCLPSFLTLAEPILEKAPAGFFICLGFMVLGMSGVIGFAAGICCFATALIFLLLCCI